MTSDTEIKKNMIQTLKSLPADELRIYQKWSKNKEFWLLMSRCLECYFTGNDLSKVLKDYLPKQQELMEVMLQKYVALYQCLLFEWNSIKCLNHPYSTPGEAFNAILTNTSQRQLLLTDNKIKKRPLYESIKNRNNERFANDFRNLIKDDPFFSPNAVEVFEDQALKIFSKSLKVKSYYRDLIEKQEEMLNIFKFMSHPRNRNKYLN